ncbi:Phospholipase D beta 1 [Dichanthelium oligosanthes]|uniref:phospholipase D n=1 Tax=Dichanthelium oligosanthes TaxID=888268 RepID=A0A1E5VUR3_9POAL|nr:Phospholipase D beta 1 [Dichanthelium oligosanthes]
MEHGDHGGHPPHYPPYHHPYPQAQAQPQPQTQLYPYGYQYPPPPSSSAPPPAAPYLAPSPSFPAYAPAPAQGQQQQQYHSGPLQPYPPPPQHHHAYPLPSHPSPYGHGYSPYPSSPYPSSYPSPNPSPRLSPSNSFHHHHASAPEPPSPAPSAPSYPIEDVLATMRLSESGRYDYAASPSVPPPSTPFSGGGSSHGGGMQLVPYGAPAGGSQHAGGMQLVPYGAAAGGSQHGGGIRPSLKVVLLHGSLDIWVHDARNLPNKDMFSKRVSELLGPRITSAVGSKMSSASMTSDPYVTVQVSYATVARTYVIPNNENPVWSQNFVVPVGHEAAEVQFVVKDSDVFGAQIIGVVSISAEKLLTGEKIQGVYPVLEPNGKPCAPGAVLHLSIQFIPVAHLTTYHHGVIAGPDCHGVPHTYFPLRRGMRVTLYQDAHVPDGCLPDIWLGNGLRYQHGQCWRDIYDAICQARKLIYIVGWSVFHTIHLVRDGTEALSLGDLLKTKSQEGVRVLLLVWDDPTSRSILGFKMVCTIYQVENVLLWSSLRYKRNIILPLQIFNAISVLIIRCLFKFIQVAKQMQGTIFTHHQKTVIVDADAGNYRRKIIAFVGGLDLCGGRYDTPWHPLFRTLQNVHKEDYYNPNFNGVDARGPREPWHDLHSKIDGPAAYDVLQNFQERWLKAAKRHGIKKLAKSYDDALLSIERIPDIININDATYFSDNDPETWHVQVFRSIDSNSAKGFPKDPRAATMKNLVCGKNVLIDMSIHTAYVHAIRAAQHYIYIENQYFIGSSFNWDSNKDLGANNLIPIEIALKIANKIRAHERFSAYIVVPMWPEGNPTGAPTQRILYWQNKTMQMMYETIYRALKEAGLDDMYEPQDYLNFFCLGNREVADSASASNASNTGNNPQEQARKHRRFMVYVHSKGMIVDDEYVIIGSANINQRSMEGIRDTEIAMGAYQPQYTWANKVSAPRGQIYGYRMSLWAEHIGGLEDDFNYPESLECMRRVRHLGEENWKQFVADEVTEMRGHLMKYPVSVDRKGKVKPLPGCTTFPDMGGNICGSFVAIQENLTI